MAQKNRKVGKKVLILCEGHTEYIYAKGLKSELPRQVKRSLSIEISCPKKNDPLSLVNTARNKSDNAKKENDPYDAIWLFFDNDGWPQLRQAHEKIAKLNFYAAYTSYCIENWFLIHYVNTGRSFTSCTDVKAELIKHWPDYNKTGHNFYKHLSSNLNDAISRAGIINNNHAPSTKIHQRNPFFTIPELIDYLFNL